MFQKNPDRYYQVPEQIVTCINNQELDWFKLCANVRLRRMADIRTVTIQ